MTGHSLNGQVANTTNPSQDGYKLWYSGEDARHEYILGCLVHSKVIRVIRCTCIQLSQLLTPSPQTKNQGGPHGTHQTDFILLPTLQIQQIISETHGIQTWFWKLWIKVNWLNWSSPFVSLFPSELVCILFFCTVFLTVAWIIISIFVFCSLRCIFTLRFVYSCIALRSPPLYLSMAMTVIIRDWSEAWSSPTATPHSFCSSCFQITPPTPFLQTNTQWMSH